MFPDNITYLDLTCYFHLGKCIIEWDFVLKSQASEASKPWGVGWVKFLVIRGASL